VTRVLVAAASAVVRAGLEVLVASGPGLTVVGHAADLEETARQAEALQPDVVLLEYPWDDPALVPGLHALGAGDHIPAVVILTETPAAVWGVVTPRTGVRAALPREATAVEIIAAVVGAAAGLVVFDTETAEAALRFEAPGPGNTEAGARAAAQSLSPREIEVLHMLAEGFGNKIIARRLGISEHTVKFHVGSIFAKLGASSRTEAVTLGVRQGLILL
jgi:NarL family two-component system response regulator YdfI